ncbi:trypsin-like peptidase domain-containing protein [Bacillus sp. FSL W7-1360]
MGYYDEHDERQTSRQRPVKRLSGLSAFGGAIIGGALVLIASPVMSSLGLGMNDEKQSSQLPETTIESGSGDVINVDIRSAVTEIVSKVSDAVVGVINLQEAGVFGSEASSEQGTGSGVIYKKAGDNAFVVTNQHVIAGASEVEVALTDGKRVPARVVGEDQLMDLAVLEIEGKHVDTVAKFGNSDDLQVGEPAIAIGNPLGLEFAGSVTQGIISAKERSIPVDLNGNGQIDWNAEVLQTDAAINPGNSGGPLINMNGEVIGINSMKIDGDAEGLGFAIPSAIVQPILADLEEHGEVRRPALGITLRALNEIPSSYWQETFKLPEDVTGGIVVIGVAPNSSADKAGLKERDVIVEVEGEAVQSGQELRKILYAEKSIGDKVTLTFYREGKKETVEATLIEQQDV